MIKEYIGDLRKEFKGYRGHSFLADLLAGFTVAAVALPLALAFGVSSGADAAAGLITAIIAAFVIGALSGASFQISGPTGAMAVILIPLALKYGIETVLAAGLLSGIILVIVGFLKAGRIVSFIPKPVVTGFISGIALILALGQVENLIGVESTGGEAYMRVFNIFAHWQTPNWYPLGIGLAVIVFMFLWPKKWGKRLPASLLMVIMVTVAQMIFVFPVETVGTIPTKLVHDIRFSFASFAYIKFEVIIMPAISIAVLGMIESLLCGTVAGKMKGEKLRSNRELVAQGIGNMVLPFFGGVPATAAIARTSVAVKSGSKTRLTGIIQGIILLLSMFFLSPFMSNIPMAALAGVLIVTAWRMNDWPAIKNMFGRKFKIAIVSFIITLLCTVIFDLTIAIAVGCLLSLLVYAVRTSDVDVTISELDLKRLGADIKIPKHVQIVYITGSVFFGSAERFMEKMKHTTGSILLLSMRGVPNVDTSGAEEIFDFCEEKMKSDIKILFCGVQPKVKKIFDHAGISESVGEKSFFWEAKDALKSLGTNDETTLNGIE